LVEAAKTAVAAASLAAAGRGARRRASLGGGGGGVGEPTLGRGWGGAALAARAARARALALPAALYAVNGYLKFALQAHFSPTTSRVLGSLKVVAIALLLRALSGRRFSTVQCQALALMAAGVAAHGVGGRMGGGGGAVGAAAAGALAPTATPTPTPSSSSSSVAATVAAAILVPSLAAVLAERGMKADPASAVQEQTFWLCAFGLAWNGVLTVVGCLWSGAAPAAPAAAAVSAASSRSLFAGTTSTPVLALVAVSAAQGVLAGVFYKHVDAVAKKLSSVGATALTALLSAAFLGHASLSPSLGVAALILGIATHQFYAGGGAAGGGGGSAATPCGACGGSGRVEVKKGGGGGGLSLLCSPGGSPPREAGDLLLERTPAKLKRLAGIA